MCLHEFTRLAGSLRDLITKAIKLKLKFDLLIFQNKIENFRRDILLKTFCHFPNVRMRTNAFRKEQGRNEVRWRPGQEASLAPPCSNLRSFGTKCTVLKEVLVTLLGLFGAPIGIRRPGNCAPLPPVVTPLVIIIAIFSDSVFSVTLNTIPIVNGDFSARIFQFKQPIFQK